MEISEKFDWFCKSTWSKSAYNTLWCLIGCSIGDFGTIYYFQVTPHSLSVFIVMLIAIINGIITSIALETIILFADTATLYGSYNSKMHPVTPDNNFYKDKNLMPKDKINPKIVFNKFEEILFKLNLSK